MLKMKLPFIGIKTVNFIIEMYVSPVRDCSLKENLSYYELNQCFYMQFFFENRNRLLKPSETK